MELTTYMFGYRENHESNSFRKFSFLFDTIQKLLRHLFITSNFKPLLGVPILQTAQLDYIFGKV